MFFEKRRERKRQEEERRKAKSLQAEQQQKKLLELLASAEAGNIKARAELYRQYPLDSIVFDMLSRELQPRVEALDVAHHAFLQDEHYSKLRRAADGAQDAQQKVDRLVELIFFLQGHETDQSDRLLKKFGASREDLRQELQSAVQIRYEELLQDYASLEGFDALREFIKRTRAGWTMSGVRQKGDLMRAGLGLLPFPDDWNDVVARLYDAPKLGLFVLSERGPGDVRLLADQAVANNNLTDAQLALAYCNHHSRYRLAVGDVLTARLARVVNKAKGRVVVEADKLPSD